MKPELLFATPGNEAMTASLASELDAEVGAIELRQFPDGETYLRYGTNLGGRDIAIVCTLDHPDGKVLALLFAAKTAREMGTTKVGLVAPYLAYMRQDRRFRVGEAVTSRYVAELLSGAFDWMVTVDPHLHRYHSLAEIYTIPTRVAQAAPLLSDWIKSHVKDGVLIGPDSESAQWVSAVAGNAGIPFTVLEKTRRGDRDVEIRVKDTDRLTNRRPIFVDDIVSTGRTMLEAIRQVQSTNAAKPICIAVHGLFADHSDELLSATGATLVTSNTVPHITNTIDVSRLLAPLISELGTSTGAKSVGSTGS